MSIRSQRDLEIILSKLKGFETPSLELEQYATPSRIAAEWCWAMAMKREVVGKTILDAASGPGILGLGLLLLGARKVFFVDSDPKIMAICMQNYKTLNDEYELGEAEFITRDITLFDHKVDVVVQNPPFGTQHEHIDKVFLEKAFSVAPLVYSMHKSSTKPFVQAMAKDHEFKITETWEYAFPIKAMFKHHTKPVVRVEVGLWRMEKIK